MLPFAFYIIAVDRKMGSAENMYRETASLPSLDLRSVALRRFWLRNPSHLRAHGEGVG